MPERSSGDQLVWFVRASLLVLTSAVVYYLTWWFLTSRDLTSWLAPLWVIETAGLLAVSYVVAARVTGQASNDRRALPRVPAAIPIRYATEEGQVGIGTLVDITPKGAGLLVPKVGIDADRVWIQFLWFEDRIGTQGRVVHAEETPHGVRLGLELQPLHPETRKLLTNFVIPYAEAGPGRNDRRPVLGVRRLGRRREDKSRREPHLPVQVQKDAVAAWAIAEEMDEQGATLLLPESVPEGARVRLSHWGNGWPREYQVVRWESLKDAPMGLFRIQVRKTGQS
ncbi:MAG: PilZ domain-containing protein [Armatimonadota bacterium]|nr:PilZ domain-containing protein [Armatimonadota bacterium]